MQAQLIALDWGTSSLRAYKLGPGGYVLEQRSLARGIMQLNRAPRLIAGKLCDNGFELALDEACGDWLDQHPTLPLIACGMVGSAQGWVQVPYCPAPARVADLSANLQHVATLRGHSLYVVPGVIEHSALPNVMRGEETQVLGLANGLPADAEVDDVLVGLPGSHSKWVSLAAGCIEHFDTFMTGELFAMLCAHTILGRTQEPAEQFQAAAFDRGVDVALSAQGDLGPLSTVFSARTLGLTGQLRANEQADYLSGLLIGHELRALAEVLRARKPGKRLPEIVLIGTGELCERYSRALRRCDFPCVSLAPTATELGLWSVAQVAGLVKVQEDSTDA